jgi:Asp-tRNA(Asn)/Glu-tRNA(Gln) amidotransferase A subunit family amidase
MARSVADVRVLFEALAGYDDRDPLSAPVETRTPTLKHARIGVFETFYENPVQPAVRKAVREAVSLLSNLGFELDAFRPEGLDRAPNLWSFFFSELSARASKERIAGKEAEVHWTYTENLERLLERPPASGWQVMEALAARDAMRRKLVEQMRNVPFLLMPVAGIAAFPHRERRFATEEKQIGLFEAMMPSTPFNLLGLPALSVPMILDGDRMPVGVQIVGRPWEEEALLELGIALEAARGKFPAPPEP